jgi:hypothetical protein
MILTDLRRGVIHKNDSGVGFFDVSVFGLACMADPQFRYRQG